MACFTRMIKLIFWLSLVGLLFAITVLRIDEVASLFYNNDSSANLLTWFQFSFVLTVIIASAIRDSVLLAPFAVAMVAIFCAKLKSIVDTDLSAEYKSMSGMVALITAGGSGVGYSTADALSSMGAKVIIACNNGARCRSAAARLNRKRYTIGPVVAYELDMTSVTAVQQFCATINEDLSRLDVLVNNAAFLKASSTYGNLTFDGIELGFGMMHLGHYTLTKCLRPLMAKTKDEQKNADVRIVNVVHPYGQRSDLGGMLHQSMVDQKEGDLRGEITKANTIQSFARANHAQFLFTRQLQEVNKQFTACAVYPGPTESITYQIFESSFFELSHPWLKEAKKYFARYGT